MKEKKDFRNVVLTGFMGAGKTSVGRALAASLGLAFTDLDDIIERDAGATIGEIFSVSGEAHFRRLEAGAVERLTKGAFGDGLVVATGGGAVLRQSNRDALKGWGVVICLRASVDEILKRVGTGDERPLLAAGDRREKIERLLVERDEAYRDCDLTIDTTSMPPGKVVEKIMSFLHSNG